MTITVFLTVLCAALLHAIWNGLVKHGGDKLTSMTAVVIGHTPIALLILPFVPLPQLESLPYILISIFLHVGYQFFLLFSYRIGDLTQVYPIARGIAPLIVAAISVWVLAVHLEQIQLIAVFIIGLGIISLSLVRREDGLRNPKAAAFSVITGCFIAAYSIIDGTGARLAESVLGFYALVALGNTIIFTGIVSLVKPTILKDIIYKHKATTLISGNASFIAYALVIWAFTQAPIALVTALRETSIIFALFIGVFFLKEKLNLLKVFSTMLTLCGAAILKLSK